MLVPLTRLMSFKSKFKWTEFKKDTFYKINLIVAHDTLSTYPDYNETFKIYTNASAFQLGAVINQKGKPISSYSRILTGA